VIRSRGAFNLFAVTHMIGCFWWGWDSWRDPKRVAGRLQNVGSGDSLDDNSAAAHLVTILPLTLVYLLVDKDKRFKAIALIATPFIVNTLILCNSRGAILGVIAAMLATLGMIRKGYRMRLAVVGVIMAAGFLFLADPQFIARQQTTVEHSDGSSQERLQTWIGGANLVKDHPFGTGGRGFHILSFRYIPEIVASHDGEQRGPHNTYVMVASEWGIAGLVAYLGYLGATLIMLNRVKKAADGHDGQEFYYWRALALQVGLIAFMITAVFCARLYAEVGYWMCAASYALYRLQATELAEEGERVAAASPQPAGSIPFTPSRVPTPA
jgi:O-antigen ligase